MVKLNPNAAREVLLSIISRFKKVYEEYNFEYETMNANLDTVDNWNYTHEPPILAFRVSHPL